MWRRVKGVRPPEGERMGQAQGMGEGSQQEGWRVGQVRGREGDLRQEGRRAGQVWPGGEGSWQKGGKTGQVRGCWEGAQSQCRGQGGDGSLEEGRGGWGARCRRCERGLCGQGAKKGRGAAASAAQRWAGEEQEPAEWEGRGWGGHRGWESGEDGVRVPGAEWWRRWACGVRTRTREEAHGAGEGRRGLWKQGQRRRQVAHSVWGGEGREGKAPGAGSHGGWRSVDLGQQLRGWTAGLVQK